MLKDRIIPAQNIPTLSHPKGKINSRLLEFIEETLPVFQKEFKSLSKSSEEELTEHLVKTFAYFSSRNISSFIFQKETMQKQIKGHNRKVDIGVFLHYKDDAPFFTFEAKRLPTFPNSREKEYVIGYQRLKITGGIERFKRNLHGVNLKESGMIGYVQSGNYENWCTQINSWIQKLIYLKSDRMLKWTDDDLLRSVKKEESVYAKYNSINLKIDNTSIKLHHYLINVTGE